MFVFFVPTGLGDHHLEVRKHMLNAALKAVNDHGKVCEHFTLKCISIECQNTVTKYSHSQSGKGKYHKEPIRFGCKDKQIA